ncbi:PREDICTED: uncharacterized protein At3g17950 [Tarenaya hassleriana]|uniref:uncharacterized protein At3g17950 n=1 Tax=Tarenaya hassleriana TaxID=28532 RepID=UPI00053CA1A2|nr:PREDICTED: uncharacterized protein At3g17950 [Tarenaya hassleriana]
MQDPRDELIPPPSSPTISSLSSSDLDTESTGSFFHDRSITLGTLMGVSFTAIAFQRHVSPAVSVSRAATRRPNKRPSSAASERHRGRKWWRLCRDNDDDDGGRRPSSLGEFLEVERRYGDGVFYGGAESRCREPSAAARGGRELFADGRVLPPAVDTGEETPEASGICRFSVSLTSICSGGG